MSYHIIFNIKKLAAFAGAVTILGAAVMSVTAAAGTPQTEKNTQVVVSEEALSLPGAGMGAVLERYAGATSGSSVELLSTTAVAASASVYNEYRNSDGSSIGKLIVYTGAEPCEVYDRIVGTERIEDGAAKAGVVARMYSGDVATLVRVQGGWYQIISDTVSGYVKKDGFALGADAEALDAATYVQTAYAYGSDVQMYAEDYPESQILCVVPEGVRCTVSEYGDELSRISVPGAFEGWVYNSALSFYTERRYAVPLSYENEVHALVTEGVAAGSLAEAARQEEEQQETAAAQAAALTIYDGVVELENVAPEGIVPSGTFVIPLNGSLSSGFGWRWGALHKGNDYWCGYGEPIYASCGGVVIEAGWSEWGYGNYVLIQHDDHFVTRYAHMSALNVAAGQYVDQYEVIGFAGETGDAQGVHCHFEILVDGTACDPNYYLS